MNIAIVATYPAGSIVPADAMKERFRNKEHASPWVRALGLGLKNIGGAHFKIFTHSYAVKSPCEGNDDGIEIEFIPKIEPRRSDPYHFYLPGVMALRSRIALFQPDIVYGLGIETGNAVIALSQQKPAVIMVQGIMSKLAGHLAFNGPKTFLFGKIESYCVNRAAGIVAENEFAKNWAAGIKADAKVRVIPHAVCPEFLDAQPDFADESILCVGSMLPHKGTDVVIKAFARMQSGTCRLKLIGDSDRLDEYRCLAADCGIANRVDFAGRLIRSDVIQAMKSARLLVIGSRMDTSPNVITEAHAAGLPVVGTAVGGIPEMIEDGKDGFVVGFDNPDEMARKMDALIGNPDLCRQFGEHGRKKVRLLNDPERIAKLHLEFFEQVLSNCS